MQCFKCNKPVSRTKKAVNCLVCNSLYHQSCGQIADATFKSIETGQTDWRCISCRNKDNRKSLVNCGVDEIASQSEKNDAIDCNTIIQQMAKNIQTLNDSYQANMLTMNGMNDQLKALQSIATTVNSHDTQIKMLEKENQKMKTGMKIITLRLENMEKKNHRNTLQFNNVPCVDKNNVLASIDKIMQIIKVTVDKNDIINYTVIRQKQKAIDDSDNNSSATIVDAPPAASIIVNFKSAEMRNEILALYRKIPGRKLYLDCNNDHVIYINEYLSANRRRLLYKAKLFAKSNNYNYVWVRNEN